MMVFSGAPTAIAAAENTEISSEGALALFLMLSKGLYSIAAPLRVLSSAVAALPSERGESLLLKSWKC